MVTLTPQSLQIWCLPFSQARYPLAPSMARARHELRVHHSLGGYNRHLRCANPRRCRCRLLVVSDENLNLSPPCNFQLTDP